MEKRQVNVSDRLQAYDCECGTALTVNQIPDRSSQGVAYDLDSLKRSAFLVSTRQKYRDKRPR